MFYSTRFKLIASFLGVSFLVGIVSLLIGGQLLYKSVLSEATTRVKLDLNAAREIYLSRINNIKVSLNNQTFFRTPFNTITSNKINNPAAIPKA